MPRRHKTLERDKEKFCGHNLQTETKSDMSIHPEMFRERRNKHRVTDLISERVKSMQVSPWSPKCQSAPVTEGEDRGTDTQIGSSWPCSVPRPPTLQESNHILLDFMVQNDTTIRNQKFSERQRKLLGENTPRMESARF